MDINLVWESIRENIKASTTGSPDHHKMKQDKPQFDAACSKLFDQRK
jgi:hypothetical protein